MTLAPGKLPAGLLARLLSVVARGDPSVVVGPGIGEDAAVIDLGGPELLVAKTDPITFARQDAPRYLLAVNSNDLATVGAEPRWLLVTALLPAGTPQEAVERLFAQLRSACEEIHVTLVGGHTEITPDLDRPVLVGCLLGTVPRESMLRTAGARAGDAILLAGAIAIEGTALLAREHAKALLARGVDAESVARAASLLDRPGISVLQAARAARSVARIHAMHDPTEGGLATALHEMADAAGIGLRVRREAIPILAACRQFCEVLGLDPLGLLASGSLLIAVDPADAGAVLNRLRAAHIPAAHIADAVEAAAGRTLIGPGGAVPLPRFDRDELVRFLAT